MFELTFVRHTNVSPQFLKRPFCPYRTQVFCIHICHDPLYAGFSFLPFCRSTNAERGSQSNNLINSIILDYYVKLESIIEEATLSRQFWHLTSMSDNNFERINMINVSVRYSVLSMLTTVSNSKSKNLWQCLAVANILLTILSIPQIYF